MENVTKRERVGWIMKIRYFQVFTFLGLVSIALPAFSATINSELGSASLDGAWAFPNCLIEHQPADPGEFDSQEFLIFQGNTVEGRQVQWTSTDGSCSGAETIVGSVTGTLLSYDFEMGALWEDSIIPERLDGTGPLSTVPTVTPLAFQVPGEPLELVFFYIDDTVLSLTGAACMYRNTESDDPEFYSNYISAEEPLCKIDLDVNPIPLPASIWLFATALAGFVGYSRRTKIT